jgi:hypothetical protein
MIQLVPCRTYVFQFTPYDYVGRRIRNDQPFVCKTLVTMGEEYGSVYRYLYAPPQRVADLAMNPEALTGDSGTLGDQNQSRRDNNL